MINVLSVLLLYKYECWFAGLTTEGFSGIITVNLSDSK